MYNEKDATYNDDNENDGMMQFVGTVGHTTNTVGHNTPTHYLCTDTYSE
jgi:hypothetical protein